MNDVVQSTRMDHRALLAQLQVDTPVLVMDLHTVRTRARELTETLGGDISIRYAIKCNPELRVLTALAGEGAGFEIASLAELQLALRAGADPADVVFSSPSKRRDHLAAAGERGVRWFTVASPAELDKLAATVGLVARPLLRLRVADAPSHWPQGETWGASGERLVELAHRAAALGFEAVGVMFHVGSQAVPGLWAAALEQVAAFLRASPLEVRLVDIGGGFPVAYRAADGAHLPVWREIGEEIAQARRALPYQPPQWFAEPGRALVADAGTLYTRVVDVDPARRFVHTDAGAFHGLYELSPAGGALELDWTWFDRDAAVVEPMRIGGISCDAADIVSTGTPLPVDLGPGEVLAVRQVGAYSLSYAGGFCGLPAPTVVLSEGPSTPWPSYEVALAGSPAFDEAVQLEFDTFAQAGYLEPDGTLSAFRRLDPICRFLVTRGRDGRIGSAVRTVDASPVGFGLLHKLPISTEGWRLLDRVDLDAITEIVSLSSARPSMRSSFAAYAAIWFDIRSRGREHAIAAIDANVLDMIERRLGLRTYRLGPPLDYMGSATVAVLFDFSERDQLAMHDLILGVKLLELTGKPVSA